MNSLYKRQFVVIAGLVVLSFSLLGVVFITLSYQYTIQDKRDTLERNADYIASFTAVMRANYFSIQDPSYQAYVASLARISGTQIVLAENDGVVVFYTDGEGDNIVENNLPTETTRIPQDILTAVGNTGDYSGMSTLGGLFPDVRFVAATPIAISEGTNPVNYQIGIVFVAAETRSFTTLWRAFITIFCATALLVLCITFFVTSFTSLRQIKPLQEMTKVARRFGHGEFDARVTGYEQRKDEIGALAEAFNLMADSLSKAEARRSEFVANISHELKTPMTTIAGFADGILDGTIPPERERQSLETISSETRRLSRLVRRMLDLSRLQAAEGVTAQEQFDVSEVLLRVLVSLEQKITGRNLDVETALPQEPVLVWGDPDAITQVCYNLLDNALKFAAPGSTIGISITTKSGKAYVSVRNNGETIPPHERNLIFDRFHKTDRSRSVDRDGVGLGLYIVKAVLDSHQENITVTSEHGLTEFTFTLTLV
ncbi:MAG: HAMP domain-containing histidine kinase [Oscillospiraceae bacterium]|nr:HAMP domain-containing histidine kinase [Oscillospiraceae bacterium]